MLNQMAKSVHLVSHGHLKIKHKTVSFIYQWTKEQRRKKLHVLIFYNYLDLLLVRQLLEHPSGDEDPLEPAIGNEFKNNPQKFDKKAKEWTAKYAK